MPMHTRRNIPNIALTGLFLAGLWLPILLSVLGYDPFPRPNENRPLAAKPALPQSFAELLAYPAAAEKFYNDHFGGRNTMVYSYMWLKSVVFGVSPTDMAVVGKDDWTYLGDDQQLASSRGVPLLSEGALETWRKTFEERRAVSARYGAGFLAFFGPDKSSIYPEYLPGWMHRETPESNLDLLHAYMAGHSDVRLLDLRPALIEGKQGGLTYLRSNSHWNGFGAFVAYQQIAAEIEALLPSYKPMTQADILFETRPRVETDLGAEIDIAFYKAAPIEDARPRRWRAKKIGDKIEGVTFKEDVEVSVIEHEDKALPSLVCFHDSFGWGLAPFLSNSFSRVVYVRKPGFSEEIIAHEKPDLVIWLRVERSLAPVDATP